jgi:hypothetical protein
MPARLHGDPARLRKYGLAESMVMRRLTRFEAVTERTS